MLSLNDRPRIPARGELELEPCAPILHRVLTIIPNGPEPLHFKMAKPEVEPAPGTDVRAYSAHIAKNPSILKLEIADTPFDINPTERCYVLLELDHRFNWEFSPGRLGVTPKEAGFDRENYGLTYANAEGLVEAGDAAVVPDGCRVLYWAILWRTAHEPRGFDFHVDFYQEERGRILRMPTIFDPGVPNTGGAGIP